MTPPEQPARLGFTSQHDIPRIRSHICGIVGYDAAKDGPCAPCEDNNRAAKERAELHHNAIRECERLRAENARLRAILLNADTVQGARYGDGSSDWWLSTAPIRMQDNGATPQNYIDTHPGARDDE